MNSKKMTLVQLEAGRPDVDYALEECVRRLRRIDELCGMGDTYTKRDFRDKVIQAAEGRFGNVTSGY